MVESNTADKRKHVVIVGAGAAGMSCAAALAAHPEQYRVTLVEKAGVCGGQATSIDLDGGQYGANWLNDGVQGGSPIFRHTLRFFRKYGHEAREVRLQVAFGKGPDSFWTNVFPSPLVERYSRDIRRFGTVLRLIRWCMPVLGLLPLKVTLRLFGFSKGFGEQMVIPLMALFLGTGNQTPYVASAILERLFCDPNMKLWDYDPDTLLPNLPTMLTFPRLATFYADWAEDLRSQGVDIRLKTSVEAVVRRGREGVVLRTRGWDAAPDNDGGSYTSAPVETAKYDELVMCTLADETLRILGPAATWRERFVLGGAKFFNDLTVTHTDRDYFDRFYETEFKPDRCADPRSNAQRDQIAFAKGDKKGPEGEKPGFRPMYYTHTYPDAPDCIEMSFDCSNYQHQFRDAEAAMGNKGSGSEAAGPEAIPRDKHVFQTIFLDHAKHRSRWTRSEIAEDRIVATKWWHQLGHRWQHYLRVVPLLGGLQGKNATWFAGSWTLVNMHEVACVSGLAVAWRLGVAYTVFDDFAEDFFQKYVALAHWRLYRKQGTGKGKAD